MGVFQIFSGLLVYTGRKPKPKKVAEIIIEPRNHMIYIDTFWNWTIIKNSVHEINWILKHSTESSIQKYLWKKISKHVPHEYIEEKFSQKSLALSDFRFTDVEVISEREEFLRSEFKLYSNKSCRTSFQ